MLPRHIALVAAVAVAAAAAFQPATRASAEDDRPTIHHVEIRDLQFTPAELTVRPGDTIIWTNHDIVPHTATAGDDSWDSGELALGASYTHVVQEGAEGDYYCRYHPAMTGTFETGDE